MCPHLIALKQQLCCFQAPLPLSLVCNKIATVHLITLVALIWLGTDSYSLRIGDLLPLSVCSAESKGAGHCHCSVWLLCTRHARAFSVERRRGEDLHENECQRLVERRSQWPGELSLAMSLCMPLKEIGWLTTLLCCVGVAVLRAVTLPLQWPAPLRLVLILAGNRNFVCIYRVSMIVG